MARTIENHDETERSKKSQKKGRKATVRSHCIHYRSANQRRAKSSGKIQIPDHRSTLKKKGRKRRANRRDPLQKKSPSTTPRLRRLSKYQIAQKDDHPNGAKVGIADDHHNQTPAHAAEGAQCINPPVRKLQKEVRNYRGFYPSTRHPQDGVQKNHPCHRG